MKTFFSNRYIDALVKTIFFFGITHLVILTWIALRGDLQVLNAFNILNLDFFMPGLSEGTFNFILSYCMVLAVYCPIYLTLTKSPGKIKARVEDRILDTDIVSSP